LSKDFRQRDKPRNSPIGLFRFCSIEGVVCCAIEWIVERSWGRGKKTMVQENVSRELDVPARVKRSELVEQRIAGNRRDRVHSILQLTLSISGGAQRRSPHAVVGRFSHSSDAESVRITELSSTTSKVRGQSGQL
jgi:hypothetical protein